MERYENLGLVGEGSYGMVLKCRHKESNQIVAIKKFIESEDDKMVKKIAMREIRMLKQLRHENLVNLLEVFRRKKRLFLVFEFVDRTVLDDLERKTDGLDENTVKKISFQVLRGLEFCHCHNIIHRDVKPENILVSKSGIVKLCDFGFARTLATGPGEVFTDYVATRWYRAPELLVGDLNYGKAVDIWAIGCLLFEMITGDPLFPGDSDIDQLFHITKCLGNLTERHQEIFHRNPLFTGMRLPNVRHPEMFSKRYSRITTAAHDLILKSLALEASERPSCLAMMKHHYYQDGDFATSFLEVLKQKIEKETTTNPLLKALAARKESNATESSKEGKKKEKERKHKEVKKKKDEKHVQNTNSHTSLTHYPSLTSHSLNNNVRNNHEHEKGKTGSKVKDELESLDRQDLDVNKNNNNNMNNDSCRKNENTIFSTDTNSNKFNNAVMPRHSETSPHESHSKNKQIVELERSDTKFNSRTPLDVSINMPGKNLPEINNTSSVHRSHGHDVIKNKKLHSKKSVTKYDQVSALYPVAEKAPIHLDRNKSIDELPVTDKVKKKETRREHSEMELSKKSGITLPSVKGMGKPLKTSPSRGASRKPYVPTIPHIQNIDPFYSATPEDRLSPTGNGRSHRDGNLPAV